MKRRKIKFHSELYRLYETPKFAVVDIETTGGVQDFNKIIEIAVIITNGKEILNDFCTLINPKRNIPEFITQLTQINYEMVADAPTFEQIAPQLYDLLKDCCFVAHNAKFDYTFVQREFFYSGFEYKGERFCTVNIGKKLLRLPSYRLDSLCNFFKIQINDRHRAYGDALATTQLLHEYIKIVREIFGEKQFLFDENCQNNSNEYFI